MSAKRVISLSAEHWFATVGSIQAPTRSSITEMTDEQRQALARLDKALRDGLYGVETPEDWDRVKQAMNAAGPKRDALFSLLRRTAPSVNRAEQWKHFSEGMLAAGAHEASYGEVETESYRVVDQEERDHLAKIKRALPDGSYPIAAGENGPEDWENAKQSLGRAKDHRGAVLALLRRTAASVGKTEEWKKFLENQREQSNGAGEILHVFSSLPSFAGQSGEVELDGVPYVLGKPLHLLPRGRHKAVDGRVVDVPDHYGARVAGEANDRKSDVAITVEHEKNQKYGAASVGRMRDFEWKKDGLWAKTVLWAKKFYTEELKNGYFRFLSAHGYSDGDGVEEPAYFWKLLRASVVATPAIDGLAAIELSAIVSSNNQENDPSSPGGAKGKENEIMNHEQLCAALGLDPSKTSPKKALAMFAGICLAANGGGADKLPDEPDEDDPDYESKMKAYSATKAKIAAKDKAKQSMAAEEAARGAGGAGAGAGAGADIPPALKELIELTIRNTQDADQKQKIDLMVERVRNETKAELASRERELKIDELSLGAVKDGRISSAKLEPWKKLLKADFETASIELEALPRSTPAGSGGVFRNGAEIRSGSHDGSISIDSMCMGSRATPESISEASDILSLAAAFGRDKGIEFPVAFQMVRGQHKDVQDFAAEIKNAIDFNGGKLPARIRPGLRTDEVDTDLLKSVAERMQKGRVSTQVIPKVVQDFAVAQSFATIGSVQVPTKYSLPIGVQFAQGELIGSEVAPEYVGGADLQASYPKFGTEIFEVSDTDPVSPDAEDIPESSFEVDFPIVKLLIYANRVWASRVIQNAAVSLPFGVMAHVAELASGKEALRKEYIQAAKFTATATYASGSYKTLTSGQRWDTATGVPLTDITAAMATVWNLTGVMPDLLALGSPDTLMALRRNQQLINLYYVGSANKGSLVPVEALMAFLGLSVVVGTSRATKKVGGGGPTATWGQSAIVSVTGRGKVLAPRFALTVVSAGYPKERIIKSETRGPDGSDGVQCSDAYALEVPMNNAAFLFATANNTLTP